MILPPASKVRYWAKKFAPKEPLSPEQRSQLEASFAAHNAAHQAEQRIAMGLCVKCGKPASETRGSKLCKKCSPPSVRDHITRHVYHD